MKKIKTIDVKKKPKKIVLFWKIIVFIACFFYTLVMKHKIRKVNCKGLKWPYLVLCTHSSFIDFAWNFKVLAPRASNFIASMEEFIGREWLFRQLGIFPKRKYTKDMSPVLHTLNLLKKEKNSVSIYPEARYSIAGVNERIDRSIGKLVKLAGVPVVLLFTYGDFIHKPQWSPKHNKVPFEIIKKVIITKEEALSLTAEEIQERIDKEFVYDEYKWILDNKIKVKSKYRGHHLHKILYKCPHCGKEFTMNSHETKLWCEHCKVEYFVNEYCQLECLNGEAKFTHIPDWYRWERTEVKKEVESGTYRFEDTVLLHHLEGVKGYKYIGKVNFIHDMNGLHLNGILDDGSTFDFHNAPLNTPSIHIDYDYHKAGTIVRGQALDIDTLDDTWFAYLQTEPCVITKIHLAVEELYDYELAKKSK